MDASVIDDRKSRARTWFEALRDDICAAFEQLEGDAPGSLYPGASGRFERTPWDRTDHTGRPTPILPDAKPIAELLSTMRATRERSRQSIEKLGAIDPRPLTFKHFRFGALDLSQWWQLQAHHDGIHLAQIRDIKRAPGFPRA